MEEKTIQTIISKCQPFTLLSSSRLINNIQSVIHVVYNKIPGDIVEIGVWKGGSCMAMIQACQALGEERNVHLYDTYEGMTPPTDYDRTTFNNQHFDDFVKERGEFYLCKTQLEEVQRNLFSLQYPSQRILFHKGDICKNKFVPHQISILRLDTDFYESTKYELETFYDSVSPGGVVIIDDYGFWAGSRKAVDEWLVHHPSIRLQPIDGEGVYFIKPSETN